MSQTASKRTQMAWSVVSKLTGIAGAVIARNVLNTLWGTLSDSDVEPPLNPADRRVDWSTALQWALAAGVGAGLARLVSQRAAAAGWEAATGSAPPGIRPD